MKNIITIKDFTFSYDVKEILKHIHVNIQEGEIVGLLGENGAGKTTLLNCLYGFLGKHDSIEIVSTHPYFDNDIIKSNVSYMQDQANLLDYLTAEQYLNFISKIEKMDHSVDEKIQNLISLFELEKDYSTKLIKDYSFGMKKKIQFISYIILHKKLFIIDEPTNGMDVGMIILMKKIIREKNQNDHTTMIISSHNTNFLQDVCDRVLLFHNGEVVKDISMNNNINLEKEFIEVKEYEGRDDHV